jgi:hypothetical protein
MVSVHVVTGGRSIANAAVSDLVNFYEVVFKSNTDNKYYRGTGTSKDGFISISVPAGDTYKVLLLAGYNINYILLAAGYEASASINLNQANDVSITLTTIPPQWSKTNSITDFDTDDDFLFATTDIAANTADLVLGPTIGVATAGSLPVLANDKLTITYNSGRLTPLINAGGLTSKLVITGYKVTLSPIYQEDVTDQTPILTTAFTAASSPAWDDATTMPAGTTTGAAFEVALPAKDVDLAIDFELYYKAFGDPAGLTASSVSPIKWIIRNGLNHDLDNTDYPGGGRIPVKIRNGSPVEYDTLVTISASY